MKYITIFLFFLPVAALENKEFNPDDFICCGSYPPKEIIVIDSSSDESEEEESPPCESGEYPSPKLLIERVPYFPQVEMCGALSSGPSEPCPWAELFSQPVPPPQALLCLQNTDDRVYLTTRSQSMPTEFPPIEPSLDRTMLFRTQSDPQKPPEDMKIPLRRLSKKTKETNSNLMPYVGKFNVNKPSTPYTGCIQLTPSPKVRAKSLRENKNMAPRRGSTGNAL